MWNILQPGSCSSCKCWVRKKWERKRTHTKMHTHSAICMLGKFVCKQTTNDHYDWLSWSHDQELCSFLIFCSEISSCRWYLRPRSMHRRRMYVACWLSHWATEAYPWPGRKDPFSMIQHKIVGFGKHDVMKRWHIIFKWNRLPHSVTSQ